MANRKIAAPVPKIWLLKNVGVLVRFGSGFSETYPDKPKSGIPLTLLLPGGGQSGQPIFIKGFKLNCVIYGNKNSKMSHIETFKEI